MSSWSITLNFYNLTKFRLSQAVSRLQWTFYRVLMYMMYIFFKRDLMSYEHWLTAIWCLCIVYKSNFNALCNNKNIRTKTLKLFLWVFMVFFRSCIVPNLITLQLSYSQRHLVLYSCQPKTPALHWTASASLSFISDKYHLATLRA